MSSKAAVTIPPRLLETGHGFGFRPRNGRKIPNTWSLFRRATNYKSEDIRVIDVNTGKSKVVFHQTDDRWIEISDVGWEQSSKHIGLPVTNPAFNICTRLRSMAAT